MTLKEIKRDLRNTNLDVSRLEKIVSNLSLFIRDSAGEDRSRLKMELFKFSALLDMAVNLRIRIRAKLADESPRPDETGAL